MSLNIKIKHMFKAALISLVLSLVFCSQSYAVCGQSCQKKSLQVKKAAIVALLSSKEYLTRSQRRVFNSEKTAKRRGYVKRGICPVTKFFPVGAPSLAGRSCNYPIGIKSEKTYVCLSGVRTFKSAKQAIKKGYSAHVPCYFGTPTPTPVPTQTSKVTPLPRSLVFDIEDGIRHSNMAVSSTQQMPDGSFRAYVSASTSSFEHKTIAYSTSNDGLTFSAATSITGVSPDTYETLTNPAFFLLKNGTFGLIYEGVKHISSAGLDNHTLSGMASADGKLFATTSTGSINSGISNRFEAGVLRIAENTLRLYFRKLGSLLSSISTDEGLSWSQESGEVAVLGTSESYAYYPSSLNVTKCADGSYRMFFAGYHTIGEIYYSRIYTATSNDGRVFQVEDGGPIIEPNDATCHHSRPDAVLLSNGKYRVYFGESCQVQDATVRNVKSALSR